MIVQNIFGQIVLPKDLKRVGEIKFADVNVFNVDSFYESNNKKLNFVQGDIFNILPKGTKRFEHKFFVVADEISTTNWEDVSKIFDPIFQEEFWWIFKEQIYSDSSFLKKDGYPNVFFVFCYDRQTRSVQVYFNDGVWDIRIYEINESLFWNRGVRFFLTKTLIE